MGIYNMSNEISILREKESKRRRNGFKSINLFSLLLPIFLPTNLSLSLLLATQLDPNFDSPYP